MNLSTTLLIFLCLFSACTKVNKTTKKTEVIERTGETINTNEGNHTTTYQQIRSKEAEARRDENFQTLMTSGINFGEKITAATEYFRSMEFQLLLENEANDNPQLLQNLYLDAATEFTNRLMDLYGKIHLKKMSVLDEKPLEMSFFALAASLHMNTKFEEESTQKQKQELSSMYSLIKTALIKDLKHEQLLKHEEILLSGMNKEMLIELIKARVDIMATLALRNLTDKREMTFGQKTKAFIFKITKGRLGKIDLPEVYEKTNEATKLQIEKYLESALNAKAFLNEIGHTKKLEKTLRSALKSIDLNHRDNSDARKVEILELIKKILN